MISIPDLLQQAESLQRDFEVQANITRAIWKDSVAERYEKDFILPLFDIFDQYINKPQNLDCLSLYELTTLIQQAYRELEQK